MLEAETADAKRTGGWPAPAARETRVPDGRPEPVGLIAVHSGAGAGDPRTGGGPRALAAAGLRAWLAGLGLAPRWWHVDAGASGEAAKNPAARLAVVASLASGVASAMESSLRSGARALVLGGDHSIAVGTWSGAANALAPGGRLGLVWLDAHMDAHVPRTSPSGNWHGMPVAHLLGRGAPELTALARSGPALRPENLCLVGVRSYEPPEARLLRRLGVRVIAASEVGERGLARCITEALGRARRGTAGFGLSIDLDVLDPRQAPGVGSPVPGGLEADELIAALRGVLDAPGALGMEIAEYNPARDEGGRTAGVVRGIIASSFGPGARP